MSCSSWTAFRNSIKFSAFMVGMSSRWTRSMYFSRMRCSMIWARVAGVPRPLSFMASASSSSSTNLPACSMAERRVASE